MALQVLKDWNVPMAVFHLVEDMVGDGSRNVGEVAQDYHDWQIITSLVNIHSSSAISFSLADCADRKAWVLESNNSDDIIVYLAIRDEWDFDGNVSRPNNKATSNALFYDQHHKAAKQIYDWLTVGKR